ncbi:uncharacterized membrane protein HdeD (DUF308 family) [Curtobacterium sp. PhB130]|uniref:DUF4064 domain-containing protein n=1 Tax=Curtobacterium sp. PhB130 TaxID=2485178 RepID=UPI000F4D2047|nr:DUF4064 domain-containing protein [Curtobacterium sp. PhB130]ROS77572.1 uncharacterized membrane protein HdeD (DUF308 family) [Curtobacterium sp. PhB130]
MTNDDRSNDDRTADGQAPSWGEPQQPANQDAPRYGERITPASAPQYGEQAPQYGQQSPEYGQQQAPQFGQQAPQYGQQPQQYGQPQQSSAAAPASSASPAWQSYDEPKAKKKTVGVIAFFASVVALIVGIVGGYLLGTALGASGALRDVIDSGGTSSADQQQLQDSLMNGSNAGQLAAGSVFMWIGTLFGLWGIVQGIVAIATKRGRGWGVFALILGVVAALVAFSVYIGIAVSSSGAAS